MSEQTQIRIKDKLYDYPTGSKIGEPALIEYVTGLTHKEWRRRYRAAVEEMLDALQKAADDDDETALNDLEDDEVVAAGVVAVAVSRAHPRWSRSQVAELVNQLDADEVSVEGGDADPPAEGGEKPSDNLTSGNGSASPSSSDSDTDLSESSPPSSGTPTLPTSPEEQSVSTT